MTLDVRRVPPRHRPALLLLALAVFVGADWLCLAGARTAGLWTARDRLARRQLDLAAARREVASRVDTKQAVRAAARALRHATLRLPDRRELAALLADVAGSAREARLELLLLRPKAERAATDHVEVPVELQVRGGYLQTLAFLRRLEQLSRLVHVGDLEMERQERTGARVVLRTSCTAVTYRLIDQRDGRAPGHGEGGTPRG